MTVDDRQAIKKVETLTTTSTVIEVKRMKKLGGGFIAQEESLEKALKN